MDEDFLYSESSGIVSNQGDLTTLRRIETYMRNDGYRIRKETAETEQLQLGFDEGFSIGLKLGKMTGKLYAECRLRKGHPAYDVAIKNVDSILLKTLPETQLMTPLEMESLTENVLKISSELQPYLQDVLQAYSEMRRGLGNDEMTNVTPIFAPGDDM
jgi:hypothetical protein